MSLSLQEMAILHARAQRLAVAPGDAEQDDSVELLVLLIGTESYAVPLASVDEVAGITTLSVFPGTAPEVLGVVSCRGTLCCAIDVRKLGVQSASGIPDLKYIVFVSHGPYRVGLLASSVAIGRYRAADFASSTKHADYIASVHPSLVALLNVPRVTGSEGIPTERSGP